MQTPWHVWHTGPTSPDITHYMALLRSALCLICVDWSMPVRPLPEGLWGLGDSSAALLPMEGREEGKHQVSHRMDCDGSFTHPLAFTHSHSSRNNCLDYTALGRHDRPGRGGGVDWRPIDNVSLRIRPGFPLSSSARQPCP
jgi:hypothetical protein